jgi:hypothetical protein
MTDSQVKGDIILKVLDAVVSKWGQNGLEIIGYEHASYRQEQWYSFEEMCSLLSSVKSRLGNNNPLTIYQLGFRTVKEDPRWHDVFDDQDPAEVFLTTKRQEAQYKVGTQTAINLGPKHVRIDFKTEETDFSWFEFYRGRLQGVLELTGRTGVVHLQPMESGNGLRSYDVKWG